jgi:hypothetical protein
VIKTVASEWSFSHAEKAGQMLPRAKRKAAETNHLSRRSCGAETALIKFVLMKVVVCLQVPDANKNVFENFSSQSNGFDKNR